MSEFIEKSALRGEIESRIVSGKISAAAGRAALDVVNACPVQSDLVPAAELRKYLKSAGAAAVLCFSGATKIAVLVARDAIQLHLDELSGKEAR